MIQDFGTDWYSVPSADQLQRQFDQWGASSMDGYVIYHWSMADLDVRPDHLSVLAQVNGVV